MIDSSWFSYSVWIGNCDWLVRDPEGKSLLDQLLGHWNHNRLIHLESDHDRQIMDEGNGQYNCHFQLINLMINKQILF